eukprot:TRINITY_DN5309_c0_g1_i5.p1 TRINITY_DN5309_c0_g1~~TRINITY_DN5309_c0_g1_i5.p1  ORF type:complete len:433 (+),score=69.12 TRINITY_DN5309_c0_g1_i5:73-1371(+)
MSSYESTTQTGTEGTSNDSKKNLALCGACGCCVCMLVLVGINYLVGSVIGNMAVNDFLLVNDEKVDSNCADDDNFTIANAVTKVWLPGCHNEKDISHLNSCGAPCFSDDLVSEWNSYFATLKGTKKVSFPSRKLDGVATVQLRGWWIPANPAKGGADSPRIVVQHGFTSNSNKYRQMYAAYMLSEMGFNVVVNNLRDHCYSDHSKSRIVQWGRAYPYDLLGAWDFAVNDAEGLIGGPINREKVGILGFSMGAFTTVNAFGIESAVPAVWVDSPPFTPKGGFYGGFKYQLSQMLPFGGSAVASWYVDRVWGKIIEFGLSKGIDIDLHLPEKELPTAPGTNRPIAWSHNKEDTTVLFSNGEKLEKLLESLPEKYALTKLIWEKACTTAKGSNLMSHCDDHLLSQTKYKAALCSFWQGVFDLPADFCASDRRLSV